MQDVGINVNNENFAPLLFVMGGEDENGLSVGIVDTIPSSAIWYLLNDGDDIDSSNYLNYYSRKYFATPEWQAAAIATKQEEATLRFLALADKVPYLDSFIFNLEYFLGADLLDSTNYTQVGGIFDTIYNTLRKNNYKFQNAIRNKYKILGDIDNIETELIEFIDEAILQQDDNVQPNFDKIINRFTMNIGSTSG